MHQSSSQSHNQKDIVKLIKDIYNYRKDNERLSQQLQWLVNIIF